MDAAQGGSLVFTMGSSGNTIIYVLVYTNAGLPILETCNVIGQ